MKTKVKREGLIAGIKKAQVINEYQAEQRFNDFLDECYEPVNR